MNVQLPRLGSCFMSLLVCLGSIKSPVGLMELIFYDTTCFSSCQQWIDIFRDLVSMLVQNQRSSLRGRRCGLSSGFA